MKSVVLCEGPDDMWFLSYYLFKVHGWTKCNPPKHIWKNYEIPLLNERQQINYLKKGNKSTAIWCVAGKDVFEASVRAIFEKIIPDFPFDPIDAVVILSDRDHDDIDTRISQIGSWIPNSPQLTNKVSTTLSYLVDEQEVTVKVTPVIIPFDSEGAIETLLMNSIKECGCAGEHVVAAAQEYVVKSVSDDIIRAEYLNHERLILKATYDATIAITNPGHSTGLFQTLVMECPWEKSQHIKNHFDPVNDAIS